MNTGQEGSREDITATDHDIPVYVMSQDQINQIAAIAGREAVRVFKSEQLKAEKKLEKADNKIEKTKKMLRSYRRVKAALSEEEEFTEEEKIDFRWMFIRDLMGSAKEVVGKSERTVKDAEKRRQEELYYIFRVEKAVEMYREECEKSGNEEAKRRYREFCLMYLGDKEYTVREISQVEKISDKTVYKDLGIACEIVAAYLFGIPD